MKSPLFYIYIPDRSLAQVYGFTRPEYALDFFRRTEMSESSVRVFNRDQWVHNANDMPYDRYLWADQYQPGLDLFDKGAAYVLAIWTSGNPPDLTPLDAPPSQETILHHWADLAGRHARFSWIIDYDQARLCLEQPHHLPRYQRERVIPLLQAKMDELAPDTDRSSKP
jgi:hypothetical protein